MTTYIARMAVNALLASATLWTAAAWAWPEKPVRIIVPFTPGGTPDVTARLVGDRLSNLWKQPVVVENRAGANGTIGIDAVAKSPPDGYTLGIGTMQSLVTAKLIGQKLPYDPDADLQPIAYVTKSPFYVVVPPSTAAGSMTELLALAKRSSAGMAYGTPGNGSPQHLAMELLQQRTGAPFMHVPYKGSAQVLPDLVAGRLQVGFDATAMNLVRSGKLKAIAVALDERVPITPDVPSFREQGIGGFDIVGWFVMVAPKGLDQKIVEKVNADVNAVLRDAALRTRLGDAFLVPVGGSVNDAQAHLKSQRTVLGEVIRKAGIKAEE
jgi:tripartite-type tricarboxylate transporter receptor subunit TctC